MISGHESHPSRLLFRLSWVLALWAGCAPHPAPAPAPQSVRPVLRAGSSGDYPPFSTRQGERFTGFSVELTERYAESKGFSVAWVTFRWPELVSDLQKGAFELAASGISVRPERSIVGRYSVPIAQTGSVLLFRRSAVLGDLSHDPALALRAFDSASIRLGVNRGGHLERTARRFFPQAQIITFPENGLVPQALARGELDAALTNTLEADLWAQAAPGVERLGPFTREDVAFYLRADAATLADELDDWLLAREGDGQLAAWRRQHFPASSQPQTALIIPAILAATAERLALMPWVAAAKARSQKAIDDPAQEQRVLAAAQKEIAEAAAELHAEPPAPARSEAFMRAQLEAAKAVQRLPQAGDLPSYELDTELRPAIARISHRLNRLLVRVPAGLDAREVAERAWSYLSESGLTRAQSDELARALATLRQ